MTHPSKIDRRLFFAVLITIAGLASVTLAQTPLNPPPPANDRSLLPAAATPAPAAATPAPAAATAAPEPAPPNNPRTSFLELLTRGGWAMWPLAACSLLGLALIIERGLALRRKEILPPGFIAGLQKIYRGPDDAPAAIDYCKQHPSSIARIMAAGIRKLPEGAAAAEQTLADQGATEIARLRRNLRMLHGIAAITPTLGLLGTVTGMIRAFEVASSIGLGQPETLMHGIYEALVATMTGLLIAVPVLFCYYLYLGIIDRTILELNDTCQAFLDDHERNSNSEQLIAATREKAAR